MKILPEIFERNRAWAARVEVNNPGFFTRLSAQQAPKYMWVGCADSRVPATEICGLDPGEIFVHRNVANVVVHTDLNVLSVLQYAVEVLGVEHVIVCGHYGCGGVKAALEHKSHGLIDNWLRNVKDVYARHLEELSGEALSEEHRLNRFCELNVMAQVANVCYTTIVQDAWARGQKLAIHGWVYSLNDGLLRDLGLCVQALEELPPIYRMT